MPLFAKQVWHRKFFLPANLTRVNKMGQYGNAVFIIGGSSTANTAIGCFTFSNEASATTGASTSETSGGGGGVSSPTDVFANTAYGNGSWKGSVMRYNIQAKTCQSSPGLSLTPADVCTMNSDTDGYLASGGFSGGYYNTTSKINFATYATSTTTAAPFSARGGYGMGNHTTGYMGLGTSYKFDYASQVYTASYTLVSRYYQQGVSSWQCGFVGSSGQNGGSNGSDFIDFSSDAVTSFTSLLGGAYSASGGNDINAYKLGNGDGNGTASYYGRFTYASKAYTSSSYTIASWLSGAMYASDQNGGLQ